MVVSINQRGTTCGAKSLDQSMSARGRLFKRPQRCRVGNDRATTTAAQPAGTATEDGSAQCGQCVALYGADRLPMAAVAARVSALYDSAALFLRLAGRRRIGADQFR